METTTLKITRLPVRLAADARLTITRLFWAGPDRAMKLISRILALDDQQASALLEAALRDFGPLHGDLESIFMEHYDQVARRVYIREPLTTMRKLLVGAYFTLEYSFASAALFNPSMTPAIDQDGVEPGSLRFALSLRAVGEGHISSIIFRRGIIDSAGNITIESVGPYHEPVREIENHETSKAKFRLRFAPRKPHNAYAETVITHIGDAITLEQLQRIVYTVQGYEDEEAFASGAVRPEWIASSDYDIETSPGGNITQFVLFPVSQAESRGMEDMRLVRFTDEDGSVRYYGTYTAYDGRETHPHIMDMPKATLARIRALRGRCARNKGLALFPRKVGGRYMMSGRIDGENLYILKSDDVLEWNEATLLDLPRFTWEFVQVSNCGSPIETPAGWLLLTHGVGPMRRYCVGAMLLDLEDPTKVIGRLEQPLLVPGPDERTGYVPNVVYSCGGLVHNGILFIPYGISDAAAGFATVPLDDLLARLH